MAAGPLAADGSAPTRAQKEAQGIYTIEGLRGLATARPPFRIDDLLAEGSTNLLIGDSGLGKTPLLVQAGICVSAGVAFLGHQVVQGPVLYCDGESNIHEFIQTAERISSYLGLPRVPDAFEVWSPNFDKSFAAGSIAEQLEAKVRIARPVFVIVDTMRVFWPFAEAKTDATMAMYGTHRQLTKEVGCTWVTAHHVRKEDRKNPVTLTGDRHRWFQEASGAKALITRADTRLGVESTSQPNADLVLAGFIRGIGWLESRYLSRVPDEAGDLIGYKLLQGPDALNTSFQQVYIGLPDTFGFTHVKNALGGKSDSNAASFLRQCEAVRLIEKVGKCYMKTPS